MKIYTKTGDTGMTGLAGGRRLSKTEARIAAIGAVDELNAALGLCVSLGQAERFKPELLEVQSRLFDLGAELASPDEGRKEFRSLSESHVEALEASLDRHSDELPPLRRFILPGGTLLAAQLHMARTVCRRAERETLALANAEPVRGVIPMYLNRLSDWLFVLARTANHTSNVEDIEWNSEER
jgi:cob(I)alamin adenosyltransferase